MLCENDDGAAPRSGTFIHQMGALFRLQLFGYYWCRRKLYFRLLLEKDFSTQSIDGVATSES